MKAQPPFADSKPIRGGDVAGKGFSLPRMPEPSTDWEANPGADRAPDPAPFPRKGVGAGSVPLGIRVHIRPSGGSKKLVDNLQRQG